MLKFEETLFYKAFVLNDDPSKKAMTQAGLPSQDMDKVIHCVHVYRNLTNQCFTNRILYRISQLVMACFGRSDWQQATRALKRHMAVAVFAEPMGFRAFDTNGRFTIIWDVFEHPRNNVDIFLAKLCGMNTVSEEAAHTAHLFHDIYLTSILNKPSSKSAYERVIDFNKEYWLTSETNTRLRDRLLQYGVSDIPTLTNIQNAITFSKQEGSFFDQKDGNRMDRPPQHVTEYW